MSKKIGPLAFALHAGMVFMAQAAFCQKDPANLSEPPPSISTGSHSTELGAVNIKPGLLQGDTLVGRATREQVAKLLVLMRTREQAVQVSETLNLKIRQQLQTAVGNNNSALSLDKRQAIAKLLHQYSARVPDLYTVDEMLADMSTIYQRYLTRQDADASIAFYSSAVGQNLLNAEPKLCRRSLPMVLQRYKAKGDALTEEMKKVLVTIKPESEPADNETATELPQ